jgi:hypothetical protein
MNLELEKVILSSHATIFEGFSSRLKNGECFECGDGWRGVIAELADRLEAYASESKLDGLVVVQVKEKFGSLRVYFRGPIPAKVRDWVSTAEHQSARTCELCAAPASLRARPEGGHVRTLCAVCGDANNFRPR